MPIYEFECKCCKHEWEEHRRDYDTTSTNCPECFSDYTVKKMSTGTHCRFEGDGFYETDYKKKSR